MPAWLEARCSSAAMSAPWQDGLRYPVQPGRSPPPMAARTARARICDQRSPCRRPRPERRSWAMSALLDADVEWSRRHPVRFRYLPFVSKAGRHGRVTSRRIPGAVPPIARADRARQCLVAAVEGRAPTLFAGRSRRLHAPRQPGCSVAAPAPSPPTSRKKSGRATS